jgi:8-oxo-dGTP pyrophosphatase MutT (NUDIX family)
MSPSPPSSSATANSCWLKRKPRPDLAFNQPAGHLEEGESLIAAVVREALEETAYHFVPTHLVGIYNWKHPDKDVTYLRFAFAGELRGYEAGAPARRRHCRRTLADAR